MESGKLEAQINEYMPDEIEKLAKAYIQKRNQ